MGSRIRENIKHFFECFCEIVPRNENQDPWIIQKYPDSYRNEGVLKSVTSFAYPCEFENTSVQHYSFVLTDIDSKWTFGFCRHDNKTETALVVLSYLPWHGVFYKFLDNIATLTHSPKSEELGDFLVAVYNSMVPDPGFTFSVTYNHGLSTFSCPVPSQFQLPSIPENRNLTEYYNAVDPNSMMIIFASMLYERRIIFTSRKLYRLSACVQSANDILYPMIWQHIFIPVLPMKLKDYLLAPMPFLIGVPDNVLKEVRTADIGDVVILNADSNTVDTPFDDLETLPHEIISLLKRELRNRSALLGEGVSRVFLRALVQLIGGYRDALRFQQGEKITFDPDKFIESRPSSMQPFLKKMLQLQIFQQFIEERLQMLNSGRGFSDEFELEACRYSEKSSSKLKQQYKEFFKSVKDKANPAVKSAVKSVKEGGRGMRSAYKGLKSKFRESQGVEELEKGFQTYVSPGDKPRSAPNSPTSSRRRHVPEMKTYRKAALPHLRTSGENRSTAYSPLSPSSNLGSPESPNKESISLTQSLQLSPLNIDLLNEMKDVLYKRHMNADDGDDTPPIDRSLKPVRSLESFKYSVDSSCTGGRAKNANRYDSWQSTSHRTRYDAPITSHVSHNPSQNLLDSFDSPTSLLFDSVDDVFSPVKLQRQPNTDSDLFGITPFVVGGGKCENGEPVFLLASSNSVDVVKLSPPTITFSSKAKKDTNTDLIRLDSTPSDSIDDFDPLLSKDKETARKSSNTNLDLFNLSQQTVEKGLSNPLYPYFSPPSISQSSSPFSTMTDNSKPAVSNNVFTDTVNTDQDLLQEYGIDFNKFGLDLKNGTRAPSTSSNQSTSVTFFDPFQCTPAPQVVHSKEQWTKFE